tara:strand:+ start:2578 stop:2811 length:234 start_codon:yes stop_codon:yes gene_type:complete
MGQSNQQWLADLALNTAFKIPFATTEFKLKLKIIKRAILLAYLLGFCCGKIEPKICRKNRKFQLRANKNWKIPITLK